MSIFQVSKGKYIGAFKNIKFTYEEGRTIKKGQCIIKLTDNFDDLVLELSKIVYNHHRSCIKMYPQITHIHTCTLHNQPLKSQPKQGFHGKL